MSNKLIRTIAATFGFIVLAILDAAAPRAETGAESAAIAAANHVFDRALSARDIAVSIGFQI